MLAVGGQGKLAELYRPANGTWQATATMNRSRTLATATLLPNGKVLVVGGFSGMVEASAELYDPQSGQWTLTGSMGVGRYHHTATLLANGKVLVAGGKDWTYTQCGYYTCPPIASAEVYDPATGTWSRTASLPADIRSYAAVRLLDGRVISIGGVRSNRTAATIHNPASHTWQAAASLNIDRYYAPYAATRLADGRVLVVGGNPNSRFAEVWDQAAGFWSATGAMANARSSGPGVALLADGRVLVEGSAVPEEWCDQYGDCWRGPFHPAELYTP